MMYLTDQNMVHFSQPTITLGTFFKVTNITQKVFNYFEGTGKDCYRSCVAFMYKGLTCA